MARELHPADVATRLAELKARMTESFERSAARALAELRALSELARHLQRRAP